MSNAIALEHLFSRVRTSYQGYIAEIAQAYVTTLSMGGKLLFAGNGGSASDASHIAAEYVVRYKNNRRAYAALSLASDQAVITACANDLGYESVFARQIEALGKRNDCLTLLSTSGESQNLLMAAEVAHFMGLNVIGLLGKGGGRLAGLCHLAFIVPSNDTGHIQTVHKDIGHQVCELVEAALTKREAA